MDELPDAAAAGLSRAEASAAVTGLGWRYVLGVARTSVRVGSLAQAAGLAASLAENCGPDADSRLLIDVRPDRLVLTVRDLVAGPLTAREIGLVRMISSAVGDAGLSTEADVGRAGPRSVQVLEIAIDALDIASVRPFWKTVLGYVDEPGHSGPEDPIVDPVGQGPAIWFQQMTEPRPQRNRIHVDISVPHDEASRRIQDTLGAAARWSAMPRRPPSGCWPMPRATRRASRPGRAGMASAGGGANRGRPPAATSTAGEGGDPAGEPLVGDGVTVGIVRIGDNVRRPARPFTATIRAFLAHLHESGFTAAPVPLGLDDQGREVLSFVPGDGPREPLPAETATDEVLIALATLIRGLHDAAAGWIPPAGAVWGGLPGAAAVAVAPGRRRA